MDFRESQLRVADDFPWLFSRALSNPTVLYHIFDPIKKKIKHEQKEVARRRGVTTMPQGRTKTEPPKETLHCIKQRTGGYTPFYSLGTDEPLRNLQGNLDLGRKEATVPNHEKQEKKHHTRQ